jgi:two-component system phosphate regulon sensor histidine kinase PhoR
MGSVGCHIIPLRANTYSRRLPFRERQDVFFAEHKSPVVVQGRKDLLEHAVSNLLGNAIKYSDAATEIGIRVFSIDGTGCIAVKDQGVGIPPEALPHIFEKFYRVKSAASSQIPGSGLGLSYVREVAAQLGGTVSVNSVVHQGSVFELRIPTGGKSERKE